MYFDFQKKRKGDYAIIVREQMQNSKTHTEPLSLTIEFHMALPASWSKKKASAHLKTPHVSVPDLDNLTKFVNDALNGILWKDDALIYEFQAQKFYSEEPKTVLTVEPYDGSNIHPLFGSA